MAIDARDGKILWSVPNPSTFTAYGPVGVANDVVFAGSTHPEGPIYAMDAKTGKNLWLYETRAAVYGGMSVSGGCIYLSNGYTVSLSCCQSFIHCWNLALFVLCVTAMSYLQTQNEL